MWLQPLDEQQLAAQGGHVGLARRLQPAIQVAAISRTAILAGSELATSWRLGRAPLCRTEADPRRSQ